MSLYGHTSSYWHRLLTSESGSAYVPTSRYGRDSAQCAWWAIALEYIASDSCPCDGDPEGALDYCMEMVVNDHRDVAENIFYNWNLIPQSVRRMLGVTKRDVAALTRQTTQTRE